jgi:hypothetical protein
LYELMNNLSTYKFLWEEIKQQGRSYKLTPVKLVSFTGVSIIFVWPCVFYSHFRDSYVSNLSCCRIAFYFESCKKNFETFKNKFETFKF